MHVQHYVTLEQSVCINNSGSITWLLFVAGLFVEMVFCFVLKVDEAQIVKEVKQYTYMDGDQYVFMDMVIFLQLWTSVSCEATYNMVS